MDRDAILAQIRLESVIEDTNVTDNEIVTMINNGMHEISLADKWPWLEASENLSLTDSTQTYSLPTNFEFMVAIVDDDNDNTLEYIAPTEFFERYGNDTGNESTQPEFWTIWEDNIYITPIPEANDTNRLKCYYYQSVTTLDNGTDVPAFHAAFHNILVEYVKWKLYEREEYYDQSERAFIQFARYLQQMKNWYRRRTKIAPYIVGDGDYTPRRADPNLAWMWQV